MFNTVYCNETILRKYDSSESLLETVMSVVENYWVKESNHRALKKQIGFGT